MKLKRMLLILLIANMCYIMFLSVQIEDGLSAHKIQINSLSDKIADLTTATHDNLSSEDIKPLKRQIDEVKSDVKTAKSDIKAIKKTSRGSTMDKRTMEVTAYTKGTCGKSPSHPLYGITASGERVQEWHTIASGDELPMGTKVYMPYFKDKPNKGVFIVGDRGVSNGRIDVKK